MELEFVLDGVVTDEFYPLSVTNHPTLLMLDWSRMVHAILCDVAGGVAVPEISAKFHNGLAEAAVAIARRSGLARIALSGGCFQNRYLLERVVTRLRTEKFQPYWHQRVPTNDGGVALGQIYAARNNLTLK